MQQSQPRKKPLRRLILTLAGEGGWALACHLPLLTNVLASAHHAVVDGRGSLINGQKKREEFRQSFCREPPECWRAWNPLVFQFVWAASQFRQTWRLHVRTKHQMLLLLYLDFRGGWLECLVRDLQLPDWQWLESHRLLNVTLHHGTEASVGRVGSLGIAENWRLCCSGSNYFGTCVQLIRKLIISGSLATEIVRGCVKRRKPFNVNLLLFLAGTQQGSDS